MENEFENRMKIDLPVFNYCIHIVYSDNIDRSRKEWNEFFGPIVGGFDKYVDGHHAYNDDEPDGVVFISPLSTVGTLTHEIFHALYRMFNWVGAGIENEVTAYHLGYCVDKVLDWQKEIDLALKENKKI